MRATDMRRAPGRDGRGPAPGTVPPPAPGTWRTADADPAHTPGFDDSDRPKAERATADNPRHGLGEAPGVVLDTDEYGERAGRHLPGAPDSSRRTTPSLKGDRPGAHRFRTTARPGRACGAAPARRSARGSTTAAGVPASTGCRSS
ncbi:hypothetical protein [Streptomyces sp. Sce081]|uniref:hypothetical protein n=1 Tax=Streptomyces sp. Sce081 TaxID=3349853 RepID=UPI0035F49AA7